MAGLSRRAKLLISSIPISALLFLFLFTTTTPPEVKNTTTTTSTSAEHHNAHVARRDLLQVAHDHCKDTLYKPLCVSAVTEIPNLAAKSLYQVISTFVRRTVDEVQSSASNCTVLRKKYRNLDSRQRIALTDCLELLDETLDDLHTALYDLSPANTSQHYSDLQTMLSAALTNQYTCLDGFAYTTNGTVRPVIERRLRYISHMVSNSLAMIKRLPRKKKFASAEEAFEGYGKVKGGFPSWVSRKDRRLLQMPVNVTKVNLVVSKDGTGNFTTIGDAVAAAPNNSNSRFVIYIKAGAYFENVDVPKSKSNLMFVGDGIGKTVVKASRNVVDGWTTFRSATVAVVGNGFIARDLTIENAAGPSKHQAVALRTGSDLSAFYRCSFVGYQDTLYVHSLRQFYRECDIYGTIDFIFGDAAVVFQNCNLYARKPDQNQTNVFTAQGREDPNQNTGISIQNCKVEAAADLIPVLSTFQTFLGRPWKQYSRTIFMQSNLGSLIDPAGWLEWNGTFALDTLYYREYQNRGPGSNTTARVNWAGYNVTTNATEASQFTVASFIQGNQWLPGASIPFASGLF